MIQSVANRPKDYGGRDESSSAHSYEVQLIRYTLADLGYIFRGDVRPFLKCGVGFNRC